MGATLAKFLAKIRKQLFEGVFKDENGGVIKKLTKKNILNLSKLL